MKRTDNFMTIAVLILMLSSCLKTYSSTPYTLLWYKDIVKRTQALSQKTQLFRVNYIHKMYPEVVRVKCGQTDCISPHIEMTNFDNDTEHIKQLPTVLIVAGFHGNEVVGTNAVYRLFDLIESAMAVDNTWFTILNNLRIIFLPMVNPSGFFNKIREETQGATRIDPNRDFNWDNTDGCFVTSAGQMINHVFKDNLIMGSLTFHGGDNSLTFPWGTFVHEGHAKSHDHVAFNHVAHMLRKSASQNHSLGIQEYNVGTMEKVVYDVNGGYEDWAYGGSSEGKYLTTDCLPANSPFSDDFLACDDSSNRAFIFLVEAGRDKTPLKGTLGNELAVANKKAKGAVLGNVSRNMTLMKQFFEVMRPSVFIQSLKKKSEVEHIVTLQLHLDVKGCQTVDSVALSSPQATKQSSHINKISYIHSTSSAKAVLTIEVDRREPQWQGQVDLQIKVLCDQHWLEANKKFGDAQSHFFRAKLDPSYSVQRKGFSLKAINLNDIQIKNLDIDRLDSVNFLHKNFDQVELIYEDSMLVQVGDDCPLKLQRNKTTHEVTLEVNLDKDHDLDKDLPQKVLIRTTSTIQGSVAQQISPTVRELLVKYKGQVQVKIEENRADASLSFDDSLVKEPFRKLYHQTQDLNRKLVLKGDSVKTEHSVITLKMAESVKMSSTFFYSLISKKVDLVFPESALGISQGTIVLPTVNVKTSQMGLMSGITMTASQTSDTEVEKKSEPNVSPSFSPDTDQQSMTIASLGMQCLPNAGSTQPNHSRLLLSKNKWDPIKLDIQLETFKDLDSVMVQLGGHSMTRLYRQGSNGNQYFYSATTERKYSSILSSTVKVFWAEKQFISFECSQQTQLSLSAVDFKQQYIVLAVFMTSLCFILAISFCLCSFFKKKQTVQIDTPQTIHSWIH